MEHEFSELTSCGHCGNISQMLELGKATDTFEFTEQEYKHGSPPNCGNVYRILKCPACSKINIITCLWHEDDEVVEFLKPKYDTIFPIEKSIPIGLPENILKAYKAAERVKTIDINAYVILLRRLLELMCIDRHAKGKTLAEMLKDLSDRNEIPEKLFKVAKGLKDFGNIGAHADIGELSEKEVPIVTALCSALLEYIYSAPYLATIAEVKLEEIKNKK